MATPGTSGSTVSNTQDEPRNCETLRYRAHYGIEMRELLGRGPSALHAQDELIRSERSKEIRHVGFGRSQSRYQVLTSQVISVQWTRPAL